VGDAVGLVKIGLELWAAEGPAAVRALVADGNRVMLDLKLHDIPNTVAGAVAAVAGLGAELLTVHATGGAPMLHAAVDAADRATSGSLDVAGVTILTSIGPAEAAAVGLGDPAAAVPRLARLAVGAGCRALVCSPWEVAAVRGAVGAEVRLICPGVRPAGSAAADQQRVATPAETLAAGADLLVVGRPITRAEDPAAAARAILAEALAAQPRRHAADRGDGGNR
jgi:orotidine-5'-phosphate decarboxylase